jgi:hypothetical protein
MMNYQVFSANEWLYPDSLVDEQGNRQIGLRDPEAFGHEG